MNITTAQWWAYAEGTFLTVKLTLVAILIGMVLGLLLALGKISQNKILNKISSFYIWVFRGTPLLLQIFVIYFSLPNIGIKLSAFPSAVIAFGLNSGAYLAEIFRASILSIDNGQMEAASALGMTYHQSMFKIIIPQAYKRLIPPVGNEFIMLLKESSLVTAIGMTDLLRTSKKMANNGGKMIYYIIAACIYLFLTSILTNVFQSLERRHSSYE